MGSPSETAVPAACRPGSSERSRMDRDIRAAVYQELDADSLIDADGIEVAGVLSITSQIEVQGGA
jgi:hypothetical protein